MRNVIAVFECNTVRDLSDALARTAKNPELSSVLDSSIESSSGGDTFTSFSIIRRTLSDKSQVLDFDFD